VDNGSPILFGVVVVETGIRWHFGERGHRVESRYPFGSCRAIQGGFLLLAMLVSYLVNDTWSLRSLSRSTGMGS